MDFSFGLHPSIHDLSVRKTNLTKKQPAEKPEVNQTNSEVDQK